MNVETIFAERDSIMVEWIDKTAEQDGTPLNRANLMAMQGFANSQVTYNDDGSITETNSEGHTLTTVKNEDGSYTQTFVGEKVIRKTIKFNDGSITEVIS